MIHIAEKFDKDKGDYKQDRCPRSMQTGLRVGDWGPDKERMFTALVV